jgi:hypothetical protein
MIIEWKRIGHFDSVRVVGIQFFMDVRPIGRTKNGFPGELEWRRAKETIRLGVLGEAVAMWRGETPPEEEIVFGMHSIRGRLLGVHTQLRPGDTFKLLDNGIGPAVVDAKVMVKEVFEGFQPTLSFESIGKPDKLFIDGIDLLAEPSPDHAQARA